MPKPNQLGKFNFASLKPDEQTYINQLIDTVNTLAGYNGDVVLSSHLDLSGNRIKNVAAPTAATDALTAGVAQSAYSAAALSPQLSPTGGSPMPAYRILNSGSQRELSSSWLSDLMSAPPNANAIIPLTASVMGGVQVTIPASLFTFADGSSIMLQSRTDVLSLPAAYAISSISCSGNIVTVVTTSSTGLSPGLAATIAGVSPPSFNGSFPVDTVTPPDTFTYQEDLGTLGGSGGSVELQNTYYYSATKRSPLVRLFGPYGGDTAENRLLANFDGTQIVAVVVLTNSGAQVGSSGGGGSAIVGSPTAGAFF